MDVRAELPRLRAIGWSLWDPICLLDEGETWEGKPFADEYDTYLLRVAGHLRQGAPAEEMVSYLVGVERDRMGLGMRTDTRKRAQATVEAIRAGMDQA